jgi:hypothetical protein
MSQTAYNINMPTNFAGMLGDSDHPVIDSPVADVAIGFGLVVVAGAKASSSVSRGSCKLPTAANATSDVPLGVSVQKHVEASYPFGTAVTYAAKDVVQVLRRGRIWVQKEAVAMSIGDAVYGLVSTGTVTNVVGSNILLTAKVACDAAAGDATVLIDVNMP